MNCQIVSCTQPASVLPYSLVLDVPEEIENSTGASWTTTPLEIWLCPPHADEVDDVEGRLLILTARRVHLEPEDDDDIEELG